MHRYCLEHQHRQVVLDRAGVEVVHRMPHAFRDGRGAQPHALPQRLGRSVVVPMCICDLLDPQGTSLNFSVSKSPGPAGHRPESATFEALGQMPTASSYS
ncbi:hypothetical protein [Streptomyces sp. NPDC051286]|uniref:hypothetical protein n=1 Tax=Streptomyces sp. NPDC051286 TaxID=3365647 RepID=UPI0037B2C713